MQDNIVLNFLEERRVNISISIKKYGTLQEAIRNFQKLAKNASLGTTTGPPE